MEKEPKGHGLTIAKIIVIVGVCALLLFVDFIAGMRHTLMQIGSNMNVDTGIASNLGKAPIHMTVSFFKRGTTQLVFEQYHAGALTKLGMNCTLGKLTGNLTGYNMTQYNLNLTYVSIGDQGTLNSDNTELPGEWNRTAGVQHDCTYNSFNITAWFYPDTGPHTADCIGLNFESGISNGALWGYDTFNEKTGIDDTFDIKVEIKVTIS